MPVSMNAVELKALTQLWGNGRIRAFISHAADYKEQANEVKSNLESYGVATFVAHDDIAPMKEWQGEIERALFSMNILVALLTKGFHHSIWTDQEVGVAIGRKVPIIPVRLGTDPYGFFGKYQAISGTDKSPSQIAIAILKVLLGDQGQQKSAIDAYIHAVSNAKSFYPANDLAELLPQIKDISPQQVERLVDAFNGNRIANNAYILQREIADFLKSCTGDTYTVRSEPETNSHKLVRTP